MNVEETRKYIEEFINNGFSPQSEPIPILPIVRFDKALHLLGYSCYRREQSEDSVNFKLLYSCKGQPNIAITGSWWYGNYWITK